MTVWIGVLFIDLQKYFHGEIEDLLGSVYSDLSLDSSEGDCDKYSLKVTNEGIGFAKTISDNEYGSISLDQLELEEFTAIFFAVENYFDEKFEIELSIEDIKLLFIREEFEITA